MSESGLQKSQVGGEKVEQKGKVIVNGAHNMIAGKITTIVIFLSQYRRSKMDS